MAPVIGYAEAFDPSAYQRVPDDWSVVLTDVVGSTDAIARGRYKEVNALGVSCIVAVRNAVPDLDLPYVFGGDGATLLCPNSDVERVEIAVRRVREMATAAFGMQLRAAVVPHLDLSRRGFAISVARLQVSQHASFALFGGGGLQEAELLLKTPEAAARYHLSEDGPSEASFEGFECRWKPLPNARGCIASVLVESRHPQQNRTAHYRELAETVFRLIGGAEAAPVRSDALSLASPRASFTTEARLLSGKTSGWFFRLKQARARASVALGRILFRSRYDIAGFPADYRDQVVTNSDYQKFDDMIRMVVDISVDELAALRSYLEQQRDSGDIYFGVHTADSATMTCFIGSYRDNHVHFIDGAEGGYAAAARQLKSQRAPQASPAPS